ncbi:MAG: hypothetical protein KGJ12_03625 [Gammaproteobacteria bacterium]|nr:hypothetical protein [Gammaproteobacteria bacterium]
MLAGFFERYTGRTIIAHAGFPSDWLGELLKQPGGGGHFRLDARHQPGARPSPAEWVIHAHVLPLALPLPLLIAVRADALYLRHLVRRARPVHPSEILWILNEIPTRHHALLRPAAGGFTVERGIPVDDNRVDMESGV